MAIFSLASTSAALKLNKGTLHLFGTQHSLKGRWYDSWLGNLEIGEGVITSPGHKPLMLKGPHVIAPNNGIYPQEEED